MKELFTCSPDSSSGSAFISEYGDSKIEYVSNHNSNVTELLVLDACAESLDGDAARVQIPDESEGYWLARARVAP